MHEAIIITAKYAIAIPILVYAIFMYKERHNLKQLLLFTVLSAIIATLLIKLGTSFHSDPRPFVRDNVVPYFKSSTDNGFPSDHTAFSAVIAAVLFRYNKRLGIVLLLLAIVIGTARVIAGVHHGQDIVGGLFIAVVAVYLAYCLQRRSNTFLAKQRDRNQSRV